ncbi:Ig-like domain-containing protein [Streptomyces sp. ME03-5709C]|nr:Ig-like domain-containing protein [Streptomyces sp. ME03-5709C]
MIRGYARSKGTHVAAMTLAALMGTAGPAAAAEPSSTSVQAVPVTAITGAYVTLTATVTCPGDPSPGLGLTFFDDDQLLDTVPVDASGHATLTTDFDTAGPHVVTAAYNGNGNCSASNAMTTVQITAAPPPPPPWQPGGPGSCLLLCNGGLINIPFPSFGDVHNNIRFD